MRLTASTDLEPTFKAMDAFVDQVQGVATTRALNKLRDQAQVAGFRKINEIYKIGPRTMETYAHAEIATSGKPEAAIVVKGRGFPLSEFHPIQTKKGVSVSIKGRRFTIPHAFMAARFGQHVFARGAYGGKGKGSRPTGEAFGRFAFGKGRLPISELFTFGPAEAFGNDEVVQAMDDRMDEQAAKIFNQEIRFAGGGGA